ncbi:Nucleotide-diphospho-sugar transferase domain-containing protein [Caenorhabditis elegans]|uniref:Nucleotide-diphospho-sugar transferase domain-containing protein n=1 Tax=Caenorhabditis elegans TaxID=6239 RepID=O17139_CAEEL|nr:Nucleotide-diphospho-sugar transferase domain-containing protein [Caenorhabditis elegans]CCD70330.1 Nucleotide-diphospho-sugar transferase domain-containing protein [Caenorhabditis elegans]|eukprot:NP_503294.1 Uncharacterized protein CELE_F31F4.1 [Caenorhabditis elegans]
MQFPIRKVLKTFRLIILILLLICFFVFLLFHLAGFQNGKRLEIGILVVLNENTDARQYDLALKSVECYAKIHGYQFITARDTGPENIYQCSQVDKLFRRHCIAAKILLDYDVMMFLDADIGVVNPKRKIEEFIEKRVNVIFYDRFQNWEIATGSYIARNTKFSVDLLNEFANYEVRLPKSLHGSDNGAIHMFLAEKLTPKSSPKLEKCRKFYEKSKSYEDLFTFEACIRDLLGDSIDFGKIRILEKGTSWVRDGWLTKSQWHPGIDFMLHGWKSWQLRGIPQNGLRPLPISKNRWYSPFSGNFDLEKCKPGNVTWNYDLRVLGNKEEILQTLKKIRVDIEIMKRKSFARLDGDY